MLRQGNKIRWAMCGVAAVALLGVMADKALEKRGAAAQGQWRKVWGDDFTGDRIDAGKWTVFQTAQAHNDELQHYAYDEVWVQNGQLHIRSRRRTFGGPDGTRDYTSGKVSTARKFSFLYGTVEMRAKLPKGRGIWPAFWLLPAHEKTWPPEIDVMEMLGHDPHTIYMSNHQGVYPNTKVDMSSFSGPDFSADYHLFTLEWAPGWLRWKVDGVTRKETTVGVPDTPMFLLLNTAVGGKWPGSPDGGTPFPQHFLIDYIHVYQATK